MKQLLTTGTAVLAFCGIAGAQSFTAGNLVVLETAGATSKASSQVILREFTTAGVAGFTDTIPATGPYALQSAGVYGGSEGFLTTSSDGKFLVLGGYHTTQTFSDITATLATTVPRVVGSVAPSGFYLQKGSSTTNYSANDIRGAVSDGTNFWASGASVASVDGIDYYGPGTQVALGSGSSPVKAYGFRIFNGQLYYSTQKAGPNNTASQLGIFSLGTGLPTSGTPVSTQVINTGANVPEDFSLNATADICYIAINMNTAAGGIQKWTRSGTTWTLAYTLGTGATNIGAYGVLVDYSGTNPVVYATTFETAGNRVIKIVDNGATATATTLVAAATNIFYKGISFAPTSTGNPVVNLTVSSDTASEAAQSVITVTAHASAPVTGNQTISLGVSGTGITSGDYTLSNATITIPNGATSGSVTFTVVDDILGEGTEVAQLAISTPSSGITLGSQVSQSVTIFDNDGNNHPTIGINTDSTTNYIDGGVTAAPASPFIVSGVMNDPTDPASTLGMGIKIHDLETADTSLVFFYSSSNTAVVPAANVQVTGTGGYRSIRIVPAAIGYSNITLSVFDGTDTTSYVIKYAASGASATPAATFWHTGMSDGSDGIPLDDNYYISGDDELNVLNVYSRSNSGLPFVSFDYTSALNLPDPTKPEADLEAATRSFKNTGKVYWLGSMSNGKAPFDNKPNRDRIFATTVSGTGAATSFTVNGYAALRSAILTWGDANGYGFTASAAAGVDSKLPSGFAAEGMVFGPDSTTLYIGMRAPLVPTATRTKAVLVPVLNFETWFNNGTQTGSPSFGSPIELDLGGRGVRDMTRLSNGTYIIVAGNPGGSPLTGAIYKWTGKATDAPVMVTHPGIDTLNMEGVMQVNTGGSLSTSTLQIIIDKGDDVYYNDGIAAKDFGDLSLRKFRSDIISSLDLTMPVTGVGVVTPRMVAGSEFSVYPNPAHNQVNVYFKTLNSEQYALTITDITGKVVLSATGTAAAGTNRLNADLTNLSKGMYVVHLSSLTMNANQKLVLE